MYSLASHIKPDLVLLSHMVLYWFADLPNPMRMSEYFNQ